MYTSLLIGYIRIGNQETEARKEGKFNNTIRLKNKIIVMASSCETSSDTSSVTWDHVCPCDGVPLLLSGLPDPAPTSDLSKSETRHCHRLRPRSRDDHKGDRHRGL